MLLQRWRQLWVHDSHPPLFLFSSLYLPQKETKRGSVNALRVYVKYHLENDFIPRFPSLRQTSSKQQIHQTIKEPPGFLIPAHISARGSSSTSGSRERLGARYGAYCHVCASLPKNLFSRLFPSAVPGFEEVHGGKVN